MFFYRTGHRSPVPVEFTTEHPSQIEIQRLKGLIVAVQSGTSYAKRKQRPSGVVSSELVAIFRVYSLSLDEPWCLG